MSAAASTPAFTDAEAAELRGAYGRFIGLADAARELDISRRTLDRAIRAGDIKMYKVGRARAYRLRTDDVLGLMKAVAP